jgi:hypothetical protein
MAYPKEFFVYGVRLSELMRACATRRRVQKLRERTRPGDGCKVIELDSWRQARAQFEREHGLEQR